jgi:cytochrome c oxidase assembly protein subunit 11
MADDPRRPPTRRNGAVAVTMFAVVAAMIGLSFASVPLYRVFCNATGFGGTPQIAAGVKGEVGERTVVIRFNADVSPELPWQFAPEVQKMTVKVGEPNEVRFRARNLSKEAIVGTATFNVQPDKAGLYFDKVQCFCFTRQKLEPGQEAELPVTFFVDPAISEDDENDDVKTITLSYTFFRAANQHLDGTARNDYQGGAGVAARPTGSAGSPDAGSAGAPPGKG